MSLASLYPTESRWNEVEAESTRYDPVASLLPPHSRRWRLASMKRSLPPETCRRLSAACRSVCGGNFEIVLVDDGSNDSTWQVMLDLVAQVPEVVAVKLARNHGHQLALSAGLEVCSGKRIFVIDADLQDPPELLGPMMARMDAGVHIVYGRRTERKGETMFKRGTAAGFYRFLNRMVDVPIPADTWVFRLMSRTALDHLLAMPERHRFIRGMVAWIGLSQEPFDYVREARFAGEKSIPDAR